MEANNYDFGTGAWSVINDKIKIKLNSFGEYRYEAEDSSLDNLSNEEIEELKQSNLFLSNNNENRISNGLFGDIPNIKFDSKLGYYSSLFVGHVSEGEYRSNGSSGGFGTWILKELMERNIIDGVIHVKESSSTDKLFEYGISRTIEEISNGAKTKYYPVEYSKVIKLILATPGNYAIVGLPSYITELRLLSEQNPVLKERIKIAVGLVCGHQKSTKFAEYLAWQCGIKPGDLETINFRKKMKDSPANDYAIEVTGLIGGHRETIVKKMKDLHGRNWGEGFFKVRASDFTDDVMNETADVTLGDAWLEEYTRDSKGNNIIVVRNPLIQSIIEDGIMHKLIDVDIVDKSVIIRSQASHYRHTYDELGYRLYKQKKRQIWIPKKRVEPNNSLSWIRKKIQDKREEICIKVPILYKKAVENNDIDFFTNKSMKLSNGYRNLYRLKKIMSKLTR